MQRFFRTGSDAVYEQARLTLDAAWGHTPPITCITPSANAPRDASGRVVLAVNEEFCTYSVAVDLLPQLLDSGAVEEIDAATYMAAVNRVPA